MSSNPYDVDDGELEVLSDVESNDREEPENNESKHDSGPDGDEDYADDIEEEEEEENNGEVDEEEAEIMEEEERLEEEAENEIEAEEKGEYGGDSGDHGDSKDDESSGTAEDRIFTSVFSDRERSSVQADWKMLLGTIIEGKGTMADFNKKASHMNISVGDRFKAAVGALYESLSNGPTKFFRGMTLEIAINKIDQLGFKDFRNARGYVLGLKAIGDNKQIDKHRFENIIEHDLTDEVRKDGVTPEDILRYARHWEQVLLK